MFIKIRINIDVYKIFNDNNDIYINQNDIDVYKILDIHVYL